MRRSPARLLFTSGVVAHSSSWSPAAYGHCTLLGEDDGQGDFFQDGVEEEEEEELEMFDESIDRFELSGWRPRRFCCDYMAGCCARGWGCTFAHGEQEFPFLEHFVDVPVLQITDEVDAAVKGSGEGGGEEKGRRRRWRRSGCSCAPDAAPWHCRGFADHSLKTEARRLWRLGGGEADFRAGVGAHHTGDEPV